MSNIKKIFGIDSLYYFAETNENYDDFFLDILDQIENIKGNFQKREIEHETKDINITIKTISLQYLGKNEGFHWFRDINEFFKIGFKDKKINQGLNDIRVQLQGVGIYTIGIKSLLALINKDVLSECVTGNFPITRVDLNCFIQYDFSFITKEMFSTRKRNYTTVSEIGNATSTQTIYVGKEPFKLRMYNKKQELKKSKKKDMMYEYFLNHDFDIDDDIFNIEFELHRTHLKQYKIQTVDDLLCNAVKLFKISMEDIRLIDINSITSNTIKNNKYQTPSLPIWNEIKEEYNLKDFLQIELSLDRIKRTISLYDDNKFVIEYTTLLRKAFMHNIHIDLLFLELLFKNIKESLIKTDDKIKKQYIDIESYNPDGTLKENLRLFHGGKVVKPLDFSSISKLSIHKLIKYYDITVLNMNKSKHCSNLYYVAKQEMINRELLPKEDKQTIFEEEENEDGF